MNDLKISQMKIGKEIADVSGSWTSKGLSWNVSVKLLKNSRHMAQAAEKHYEAVLHTDAVITKNQHPVVYVRTNILG